MKKILNNKFLFWVIQCTWGGVMTLVGAVIALGLTMFHVKHKRFHNYIYFEIGKGWGGFNCGAFFFTCKDCSLHTKQHEAGHGIQNIMLGVFMPFVVSIPSVVRYWWSILFDKLNTAEEYERIWFERTATALGEKYFKGE